MTDTAPASRRFHWFPVGIALYLTLVQWNERTGAARGNVADLVGSAAAAVGFALLAMLVASRFTRDRDRAALIALACTLWAALYLSFQISVYSFSGTLGSPLPALFIWTGLIALLSFGIARSARSLAGVTRALNIASPLLLLLAVVPLFRGRPQVALAPLELATRKVVVERSTSRPDVYVLVLDKYTGGAWLKETYGLDHAPFEDSLTALGFAVPSGARANYTHTQLSVTSLLEGRYLEPAGLSWETLGERITRTSVWERMRDAGYRYAFFPSTFGASRTSTDADIVFRAPIISYAPVGGTWWLNSPFWVIVTRGCAVLRCEAGMASFTPYPIERLEALEWKLRMLASLPDSAGPTVAFLHILTPHEPYLFNEDCSARSKPWWPLTDVAPGMDARVRAAYATQVRCLDRLLLATVTEIVRKSAVPPVIILQADHGHGRFAVDVMRGITLTLEQLSDAQLGERFGIFAAYKFPDAATRVPPDISPVNVMRLAIGPILGLDSTLLPTRSYWSAYQTPFQFIEIPQERLAPPARAERR